MSTILVVDDQPANRQFLVTLLGYFAHDVLEAGDGVEALEVLRVRNVELIITDLLMPTLDGYDFLRRLRGDPHFARIPVIFYSAASYESEARAIAEERGVQHFLTKPADPERILAAVNSALGSETMAVAAATLSKFSRRRLTPPADPIDTNAVVFVVDDDWAFREWCSQVIVSAHLKVEAFATAEEFLERYEAKQPGCLVLDIHLSGMTGIALLEILRSRRSQIPTIILTGSGNTSDVAEAMRLRALDFLEKPVGTATLLARIYRGLQEDSIRLRAQSLTVAVRKRMAKLTTREKDLVQLLVAGKSSKEIAAELCISVKTVSNHRAHVMAKTRALNAADLVRMSISTSK